MSILVDNARYFAILAHEGQVRKYTGEPYWHHCRNVAKLVDERTAPSYCFRDEMIAAAWLHDTIEDTHIGSTDIMEEFGNSVWWMVMELTDKFTHEKYPHLNRARRKELECDRMQYVKWETKQIKLCDLIDNTTSIVEQDPKFAIIYLREKANLLEAMGFGNDN